MERKELLKLYLNRYNKAKNRIEALEMTRKAICADAEVPYHSSYSKDVKVQSSPSADGMLCVAIRLEEVNERIDKQRKQLSRLVLDILTILEFLPVDSDERTVLEMKYIQKRSDKAIYSSMYISKSQFYKIRNKAFNTLLRYSKVNKILNKFERELEDAAKLRD